MARVEQPAPPFPLRELDTPALVVDLPRLERNLGRWQLYCDEHGLRNRPHAKTHKCIELARRQLALGAVGLTCQKLSEAEVLAASEPPEILIPYNILGASKLARLARLLARVPLVVSVDADALLAGLARAAAEAGRELGVLVECDAGFGRAGVASPAAAAELAARIARHDGLRFAGFLSHPVLDGTGAFLVEACAASGRRGLEPEIVSIGGTRTMWNSGSLRPPATEYRAGSYVFYDLGGVAAAVATPDDVALTVTSTVVSRPARDRAILDAGSKTLSSDPGPAQGCGTVAEAPGAVISRLDEEHAIVSVPDGDPLTLGARVSIVPNHVCATVALADVLWIRSGDQIVDRWAVAARGCTT